MSENTLAGAVVTYLKGRAEDPEVVKACADAADLPVCHEVEDILGEFVRIVGDEAA